MKPEVKVIVMDNGLRVSLQVPGLHDGLVEITMEDRILRVVSKQPDGCGPFESLVDIPAGYDRSQGKAAYFDGELRIGFPKL